MSVPFKRVMTFYKRHSYFTTISGSQGASRGKDAYDARVNGSGPTRPP